MSSEQSEKYKAFLSSLYEELKEEVIDLLIAGQYFALTLCLK